MSLPKFIILFFLLVLLGCENKKTLSVSLQDKTAKESILKKNDTTRSQAITHKKQSILTTDNSLEFFKQYDKKNPENKVRITTDFGEIDIKLFNKTRYHRSNFIYLTKKKYFNGTQFYRVVKDFVIQGGSSDDYNLAEKRRKIGHYLLPKDNKHGFTHVRGAVSMPASESVENPHKLASPFQFFIIQRKEGAAYLDKNYTVFGKVIKGMDVVDKISKVETDTGEWPVKNVYIRKVEIIN